MITITLPEWFAWFLVALAFGHLVTGAMGLYVAYLKYQLAQLDRSR